MVTREVRRRLPHSPTFHSQVPTQEKSSLGPHKNSSKSVCNSIIHDRPTLKDPPTVPQLVNIHAEEPTSSKGNRRPGTGRGWTQRV